MDRSGKSATFVVLKSKLSMDDDQLIVRKYGYLHRSRYWECLAVWRIQAGVHTMPRQKEISNHHLVPDHKGGLGFKIISKQFEIYHYKVKQNNFLWTDDCKVEVIMQSYVCGDKKAAYQYSSPKFNVIWQLRCVLHLTGQNLKYSSKNGRKKSFTGVGFILASFLTIITNLWN